MYPRRTPSHFTHDVKMRQKTEMKKLIIPLAMALTIGTTAFAAKSAGSFTM